jgi:hypothetical protein
MGDDDPGDPTQDGYDISRNLDPSVIDSETINLETPYADPGEFLSDVANDTAYGPRRDDEEPPEATEQDPY